MVTAPLWLCAIDPMNRRTIVRAAAQRPYVRSWNDEGSQPAAARPSSRTPPVDSRMLKCSVHATARRSVRLHGAPTLPRPRPTTYALRRESNLRRTPPWRGRIAGAARAQPSRRARPSAVPAATLPLLSHCSSPRLNTDSPQTILSGARTRRFQSNCSCALRRWPTPPTARRLPTVQPNVVVHTRPPLAI